MEMGQANFGVRNSVRQGIMSDIELHAKSDRELLLIAIGKLNGICDKVERHELALEGNGKMGLKSQVRILWLLASGVWAVALVWIKGFRG